MQITLSEFGGLTTNNEEFGTVDSTVVDDGVAIVAQVNDIAFFSLPSHVGPVTPDVPYLRMLIVDGDKRNEVTFVSISPLGPLEKILWGLQSLAHSVLIDLHAEYSAMRLFRPTSATLVDATVDGGWSIDQVARVTYSRANGFTLQVRTVGSTWWDEPRPLTAADESALLRSLLIAEGTLTPSARRVADALIAVLGGHLLDPLRASAPSAV